MSNYSGLLNALVNNYNPLKSDCKSGLGKTYQNTLGSIQNNTEIIKEINSKLNSVSEEEKCKLLNIKNDIEFCRSNSSFGGRRRKHRKTKRRKSMKKRRRHTRRR